LIVDVLMSVARTKCDTPDFFQIVNG